ncbi:ERAP1, partial [Cordylochernes scorpioides]
MGQKEEVIKMNLLQGLKSSYHYTLDIKYTGAISQNVKYGVFLTKYTDNNGETKNGALTQFEPGCARMAFPCFDEPFFKSSFELKIIRPSQMVAISNMPILRSIK